MRRMLPAALATLVLAGVAAPAAGAPRPDGLWATVNACDGEAQRMGVRARMPGNGTDQVMSVRFQARWFDERDRSWRPVAGEGTSPWIELGSARVRYQEGGFTFAFEPPPPGGRYVLRGLVDFRWSEGGEVVRELRATTKGGFAPDVGGSAGLCELPG